MLKTGDVGAAQPQLARPVDNAQPAWIFIHQFINELSGTVAAVVINHQNIEIIQR